MSSFTYLRAPAFDSVTELLDWAARNNVSVESSKLYEGPDGSVRGSGEVRTIDPCQVRVDDAGNRKGGAR
jgi:hypothetical protein